MIASIGHIYGKKMIYYGISGKLINVIQNLYMNFKSCIRNNGQLTESFDVTVGVLQGEALSPFLFSLYLNDFESFLMKKGGKSIDIGMINLFLILYADDTVIISDSAEGLQRQLNALYSYCADWKLTVNVSKTKIMVFRNRGKLNEREQWFYNGIRIEVVNTFNYLGLLFYYNGKFTITEKLIANQGRKAMFAMAKSCRGLSLNTETEIYLFNTYILPVLNYGCETWGYIKAPNIENVQLRFCKRLLGVNNKTMNAIIYNELGIYPLYVKRQIAMLKYWCALLNSENCILKELYNQMYIKCTTSVNWASQIKSLLDSIGMSYIWYNQNVNNINSFICEASCKIKDIFKQNNTLLIERSTKCQFYKHLTDTFCLQNFLTKSLTCKVKTAICKIRCSAHKLSIEQGRYMSVERNQRLCLMCNLSDIEDEFHFILKCPLYKDLRKKYLKP